MTRNVFKRLLYLSISAVLSIILLIPHTSRAEGITYASYDLEQGGTQIFYLKDNDNNDVIVTVEEMSNNARTDDGLYKITYTNPGIWTAGFTVIINSYQIASAHSPFHSTAAGTITGTSLIRNSTTKATYSFLYKHGLMSYSTGVIAEMSGTELTVRQK